MGYPDCGTASKGIFRGPLLSEDESLNLYSDLAPGFFFFKKILDIFVQQVRILLRRTAWAGQTVYWKGNMKIGNYM